MRAVPEMGTATLIGRQNNCMVSLDPLRSRPFGGLSLYARIWTYYAVLLQ